MAGEGEAKASLCALIGTHPSCLLMLNFQFTLLPLPPFHPISFLLRSFVVQTGLELMITISLPEPPKEQDAGVFHYTLHQTFPQAKSLTSHGLYC